jgi:hypothetical protein
VHVTASVTCIGMPEEILTAYSPHQAAKLSDSMLHRGSVAGGAAGQGLRTRIFSMTRNSSSVICSRNYAEG